MPVEPLNLPKAELRLKKRQGQIYVWCVIRKKELLCTPEEWVRQHVLHYLIYEQKIPIGLIASELSLTYNTIQKRADIVIFGKDQQPRMIVECKATKVPITEQTLHQIAQYNFALNVDYLMLTNGLQHVFCRVNREASSLEYLKDFPSLPLG